MNWRAKYIIVDTGLTIEPIVFSETLQHANVAYRLFEGATVLGAGFCHVLEDEYICHGESVSLGVKSRWAEDSRILNKYLGGKAVEE
jgi:hypothetical protein